MTLRSWADLFNNGHAAMNINQRQFAQFLINAMLARKDWIRSPDMDPRRNLDDECGYPTQPSLQDYQNLFDRNPIANRVVKAWAEETWQVSPTVYEDEDPAVSTQFENAWVSLGQGIRSEPSWYQDETGSVIWDLVRRADEQSGIGPYGIFLLGLSDQGEDLSKPAVPREYEPPDRKGARRLTFMRVYPAQLAEIANLHSDASQPRYGFPEYYNISQFDPTNTYPSGLVGADVSQRKVHWTRVVHIADNVGSSEVWGVPRLHPVLNTVLDLRKLYGSSAEMFYKGAFFGLSLESDPSLGTEVDLDVEGLRDMMENYMNGLQRYIALKAMSVRSIAPQVADPTSHINCLLDSICVQLSMPKRIFMGSEMGQLASGQDAKSWNRRVKGRQINHATPRILIPLVDRLIWLGVLPKPKLTPARRVGKFTSLSAASNRRLARGLIDVRPAPNGNGQIAKTAGGYSVWWPDAEARTDDEKAAVAERLTRALAQYIQSGADTLIPPLDFLTRILQLTEEEAATILRNAEEAISTGSRLGSGVSDAIDEDQAKNKEGGRSFPTGGPNSSLSNGKGGVNKPV